MVETEAAAPTQDVPWGWGSAIAALAIAFVWLVLGQFVALAIVGGNSANERLAFAAISYQFLALGVLTAIVLIVFLKSRAGPAALGFRFPGWEALALAAASWVVIIFAVALFEWAFNALFPGYHLQGNTKQLFPGNYHGIPLLEEAGIFLWIAVEAPLVEETLFRGIVYQGLRSSLVQVTPRWLAILIAALISGTLFGAAHGEWHTFPILVLLGFLLAYVFQYSRSLYGSMIVHGLFNAVAVISVLHSQ